MPAFFNRLTGVAVSAYPSFSIPGGTLKLVSAYRTAFNVPPGKLKLEKAQFQITSPSFRLPLGVR